MRNVVLFFVLGLVLGCAPREKAGPQAKYREARTMMGTVVVLDVCTAGLTQPQIDQAYHKVWARLEEIAWRMNVFDEKSEVQKINRSRGKAVSVEADTYKVLSDALHYSKLSKGAFDITVWPLIELWKQAQKKDRIPGRAQIAKVLKMIGSRNIQLLDDRKVKMTKPGINIDLGGIAKGYAVDEAARLFRESGIKHFFIDAGGDLYVGGNNCQGSAWRIGVRDPRSPAQISDIIEVTDMAVTTSGNYERYFQIEGQRWSHILNPLTGYPQKGVISATVIAPTAEAADALSTALCVLGHREGINLIDGLGEQYAALLIEEKDERQVLNFASKRYGQYRMGH